ncbi:hypothetical protein OURE66S_00225 [Oligella ureolytica]
MAHPGQSLKTQYPLGCSKLTAMLLSVVCLSSDMTVCTTAQSPASRGPASPSLFQSLQDYQNPSPSPHTPPPCPLAKNAHTCPLYHEMFNTHVAAERFSLMLRAAHNWKEVQTPPSFPQLPVHHRLGPSSNAVSIVQNAHHSC